MQEDDCGRAKSVERRTDNGDTAGRNEKGAYHPRPDVCHIRQQYAGCEQDRKSDRGPRSKESPQRGMFRHSRTHGAMCVKERIR